jgi:hypothetical protein
MELNGKNTAFLINDDRYGTILVKSTSAKTK